MFTMNFLIDAVEVIFGIALFINALLFIPQAMRIFKEKSATGVSLSTFLGFLVIQFFVILHGFIHDDYPLIVGYALSMVTCGVVVALIIKYKPQRENV